MSSRETRSWKEPSAAIDGVLAQRESSASVLRKSLVYMALPLGSAVLLAASFPPFNLSFVAWVALIPIGLAMTRKSPAAELYVGAFVGGLLFHLAALDWMRTSYGGSGLSGPRAMSWFITSLVAAFTWQLALWAGRQLRLRRSWPMALSLPLVWVACEFVRKYLYMLPAESAFPWLQLGTTQVSSSYLAQVADLGGVWAVTAVVAMVNGLWIDLGTAVWRRGDSSHSIRGFLGSAALCTGTIICCLIYGSWRLSQRVELQGPAVWLMPGEVAVDYGDKKNGPTLLAAHISRMQDNSNEFNVAVDLRSDQKTERTRLLLWPEMALNTRIGAGDREVRKMDSRLAVTARASQALRRRPFSSELTVAALERYARSVGATLAIGCGRYGRHQHSSVHEYNSVAIVDPIDGFEGCYDKVYLVPYIEFTPSIKIPFLSPSATTFTRGTTYPVFDLRSSETCPESRFAATICYDTCFPESHARFMNAPDGRPPDFFIASSCEAVDNTLALQQSIFALARFRAIECRRAVIRNVEHGYSCLIDGSGRLIAAPPVLTVKEPFLLPPVPIDTRFSLYVILGEWLPMVACVALLVGVLSPRRRSVINHPVRNAEDAPGMPAT